MDSGAKVYVQVDVIFDESGLMRPSALFWEDGTRYEIDRVLDCRPAAAMKAGGCGDRYTVRIGGRNTFLFFERSTGTGSPVAGRWFVERRA